MNDLTLDESRVHVEKNEPPIAPEEIIVLNGDVDGLRERDFEQFLPHLINVARLATHLFVIRS